MDNSDYQARQKEQAEANRAKLNKSSKLAGIEERDGKVPPKEGPPKGMDK